MAMPFLSVASDTLPCCRCCCCHPPHAAAAADGCPADKVSWAILIDSLLHRWSADREGQPGLLRQAAERWEEACRGPLEPHTFLHQPQGRLVLDLHGYSAWTAQLAVLATLGRLLQAHGQDRALEGDLSRLDVITGRGNRRYGPRLRGWLGVPRTLLAGAVWLTGCCAGVLCSSHPAVLPLITCLPLSLPLPGRPPGAAPSGTSRCCERL
jgi:hypothetical protein